MTPSVTVCPQAKGALRFDVEREQTSAQTTDSQQIKVSARLAGNKRVVVGNIAHPDGSRTEIAATLQ